VTGDLPFGDDDGSVAEPSEQDRLAAAEDAALRLLASREHTRAELDRKLADRGHAAEVVTAVLDDLAQRGLQSDERYTEQYVALRTRKGYGPLRIRAELAERGIPATLIEDWLDPRDPDWRENLREVARSKFGERAPEDRRDMARRVRFLEYRGFPQDLIRRLLLDE
jgi:regulatory protein